MIALIDLSENSRHPPLGLAYIASYARKYGFENIRIIDKEEPMRAVRRMKPDAVGISALSVNFTKATSLAGEIKSEFDIPVMVGGPHITALPRTLPKQFDAAVLGEGEQTFLELMCTGLDVEKIKGVRGIAYHDNGVKTTPPRGMLKLDEIPHPARDLLKIDEYYLRPSRMFRGRLKRATHILTSRGCPYRCVYCSTSSFWQKIRFHSPEYVIGEINEMVEKYKRLEAVSIYDDLFIADVKRLRKIADLASKERISDRIMLFCQCRADLINNEVCTLLRKIGVTHVSFGLETGSDSVLAYLKKNTVTVAQNRNAIMTCKKHGFHVDGSFMIGTPHETREDMEATYDFIKSTPIDSFSIYITTPFPGTEIWDYAVEHNLASADMEWGRANIDVANPDLSENIYLNEIVSKGEFYGVYKKIRELSQQKLYGRTEFNLRDVLSLDMLKVVVSRPRQALKHAYYTMKRSLG